MARRYAVVGGPLTVVEPPFGEVVLAEAYWFPPGRPAAPAREWLFARLDEVGEALTAR